MPLLLVIAISAIGAFLPISAAAQQPSGTVADRPGVQSGTIERPRSAPTADFGFGWSRSISGGVVSLPVVSTVRKDSPASRAGLSPGVIILHVEGRDMREPIPIFPTEVPGNSYSMTIQRGEKVRRVVIIADPPIVSVEKPN